MDGALEALGLRKRKRQNLNVEDELRNENEQLRDQIIKVRQANNELFCENAALKAAQECTRDSAELRRKNDADKNAEIARLKEENACLETRLKQLREVVQPQSSGTSELGDFSQTSGISQKERCRWSGTSELGDFRMMMIFIGTQFCSLHRNQSKGQKERCRWS